MAKATLAIDPAMAAQDIAQLTGINIQGDGTIRETAPGEARGRQRDPLFEQRMDVIRNRNRVLIVRPATIFNYLPIKLTVNATLPGVQGGVPPASGAEQKFAVRTWTKTDIVPFDTGDNGREPHEFHPMQAAEAFVHEYPHGGVVALYDGPEAAEKPENQKILKDTERAAVRWMQTQVARANDMWNAPNRVQRHHVTTLHRACAERLHELGLLKVLQEWVNPSVDADSAPEACISCGKRPENNGAVKCACGEILDPEQAYTRGVITEEHESLERLTRAQVIALNISDFVAETVDEKSKRVKAGVPRPPSKAVLRIMAAEDAQKQGK